MPITRRTSARKKTDNCDQENNKENIHDNEENIRSSKVEAMKKIEENRDDSGSFISTHKKPLDTFDQLYSSPMKQEVNFKPLSFWSKKVKDLESKENVKKKKCELYELSETDESNSSQGNNYGKKAKKKGRTNIGRQKNKKSVKKFAYDFNVKNLEKRPIVKTRNENKEGSIIRERIILRRLNEKFTNDEDKFSFKKVTALGLTSTPGNSERLNIVGGSTFDFLSPIPPPDGIPKITHELESDMEGGTYKTKGNISPTAENVTPKRLRNTRNSKKVLTKDLKRVSGSEHPMGDYLRSSCTEFSSFTERHYLGEFVYSNFDSTVNCKSKGESPFLNCDYTLFHTSLFEDSQDVMNKSFLHISEGKLNGDIGEDRKSNVSAKGELTESSFNFISNMREQEIATSLFLKTLFISPESNTKVSDTSFSDSKSYIDLSLPGASLQVNENLTTVWKSKNFELEEFPPVQDESTRSACNSLNTSTISIVRRNSLSNVTVRRYRNAFLNFRRSAEEGSFELPLDENYVNKKNEGDSSCTVFINDTLSTSQTNTKLSCSFNDHISKICDLDVCDMTGGSNIALVRLSISENGSKDQQTHGKSPVESTINSEMGSSHNRSKETSVSPIEEHFQIYSDTGNDSSVFISSPETPSTVESVNYSTCKTAFGKEREQESDNGVVAARTEAESSYKEHPVNEETNYCVEERRKYYSSNCKREGSETNESSPVLNCSPVKMTIVDHSICDITLGEEFDFPLPVFESTTCVISEREPHNNSNNYGVGERRRAEKVFHRSSKICGDVEEQNVSTMVPCRLKPGKKWARSASVIKKSLNGTLLLDQMTSAQKKGKMYRTFVEEVLRMQNDFQDQSLVNSIDSPLSMTVITSKMSDLSLTMRRTTGTRTVKVLDDITDNDVIDNSFRCIFMDSNYKKSNSTEVDGIADDINDTLGLAARQKLSSLARSHVLMRCNQEAPLPFEQYFNEKTLKNCKKIGEGTFGEVFMCNSNRVIKVMPIEGPDEVNGERQKKFDEILSEIIIAMELSNLRNSDKYRTDGFCELKRCWCVQGKYPSYLIDLWNDFDSIGQGSENDSPLMFKSDQLYIVLEFGNGGKDLEAFVFTSGEQTLSVLFQVAYSLAVAENLLEFEHRDLHWGNILIAPTKEKYFKVIINNEVFRIPTKGVKVTIIDFTLSRIKYDGCCVYNDLAVDPTLFTSEGDYQFDIYRMMKREVMNDWSLFRPKTNIFWIHYVADKMVKMVRYKKADTKIHKVSIAKLDEIKRKILTYSDSKDFALNCDFP